MEHSCARWIFDSDYRQFVTMIDRIAEKNSAWKRERLLELAQEQELDHVLFYKIGVLSPSNDLLISFHREDSGTYSAVVSTTGAIPLDLQTQRQIFAEFEALYGSIIVECNVVVTETLYHSQFR